MDQRFTPQPCLDVRARNGQIEVRKASLIGREHAD